MRAGTQTLIQALQALPWTADPDNDDEVLDHGLPQTSDTESESEEGEGKQRAFLCRPFTFTALSGNCLQQHSLRLFIQFTALLLVPCV
jgi:hypothetical protein